MKEPTAKRATETSQLRANHTQPDDIIYVVVRNAAVALTHAQAYVNTYAHSELIHTRDVIHEQPNKQMNVWP